MTAPTHASMEQARKLAESAATYFDHADDAEFVENWRRDIATALDAARADIKEKCAKLMDARAAAARSMGLALLKEGFPAQTAVDREAECSAGAAAIRALKP